MLRDRARGVLLGTAVGDALGLPREGLTPGRGARIFGDEPRHQLFLGRGMVSDDTEHALFVSQSLLVHPDSVEGFAKRLAWCLRGWILGLPAGIGLATLRSIVKLWLGFPPHRSGVYSAGNGPAMRAAPIGLFHASRRAELERYVAASTRLTHTDPRALTGATTVALVTAFASRLDPLQRPPAEELLDLLASAAPEDAEWMEWVQRIRAGLHAELPVTDFAGGSGLKKGVTGYVYHTVPVAVYAWFRHYGDFRATLGEVLRCGGDSDTAGAIAGAMAGALVGESGIPEGWVRGIVDWPRSTGVLRQVADRMAEQSLRPSPTTPVRYAWQALPLRNLLFLVLVLLHGFRRLAPPY